MITKDMVQQGYDAGVIKLIMSPNEDGVVCGIGGNWFYFGGLTAEECKSVEEFKRNVPKEDILKKIHDTLADFDISGEELHDEYEYYEAYLREHGIDGKEQVPSVSYHLVDFAPGSTNRLNSPDLWDKIYKDQQVPEVLKEELLIRFPELKGKDVEFGVYSSSDKSAYVCAFCEGLAYRNMGVSWSFVGGAKIEKQIAGKRLKITGIEKGFGNNKPAIQDLIQAAYNRQEERRRGNGHPAKNQKKADKMR